MQSLPDAGRVTSCLRMTPQVPLSTSRQTQATAHAIVSAASQSQTDQSEPTPDMDDAIEQGPAPSRTCARSRPSMPVRLVLISEYRLFMAGLTFVLEGAGMAVAGQFTGCDDAVAYLTHERSDIILLDVGAEHETFRCLERLLSTSPTSRILVLTERGASVDSARLIQLGASGLMAKTAPPEMLVKAVQRVHAGELWLDRMQTSRAFHVLAQRRRTMDLEASKIAALTKREHEIIALVGEGLKNAAIGERLFISESTVRNHLTSILDKLDVDDRFELVVYAFKHRLVQYHDVESGTSPSRSSSREH
jgi:two-component system, NarL family, nitrate/nitrite response regulator NarL